MVTRASYPSVRRAGPAERVAFVGFGYLAALCALPFAGALAATLTRKQIPIVLVLLLPAALTVLYLLTVRQVMGFIGRYYIPLLPFIVGLAVLLTLAGGVVYFVRTRNPANPAP